MTKKKFLILYFLGSIVWIFSTNYLLEQYAPSSYLHLLTRMKEVMYIGITAFLFYYFINKIEELNTSKEDKERLLTLINSMVDFINFKDGKGRWIEANEVALELFGLDKNSFRGKTDMELSETEDFYKNSFLYCITSDEETWKKGEISRIEEYIPLKNGSFKTFDTIKVPLFHENGSRKGMVIIGRDITEKKEIDRLLKESQQQYKSLFLYSQDIIFMMDLEGGITNVNPQFNTVTGFDAEEIIERNITEIFPERFKESIIHDMAEIRHKQTHKHCEMEVFHKKGHTLTLECTAVPMIINDQTAGIICYGKDVTKLRLAEEKLRRTEKLSVVGELSASIAHEIRNPLTSLKGFVQVLETDDPKHQFYYRIMEEELDRINHIVSELLLLAKPQEVKFIEANMEKLLYNVISLLKTEASLHNIAIDFTSTTNKVAILCEPNQLKQLFINIIKNAIEASADGDGIISVDLQHENHFAVIVVKDNGIGISNKLLERLGEPFYSSKEKGTGLGLTVSFKIVQSHGGTIHFASEQNKGTVVTIKLPIKRS
ncbi:PAS domain-containing sensor histidine kinase [Cytobacillus purgationiresistens]|uniref:histidine kinase n=1 Tax=Cytobacillus purgationiresistens TaxID=863449 RepID=A0ABU0ARQ8_9BACI|nr:PAS domain-containing sensor histidine kinase [Cytobacillus purgationiresistens]MDQ0273456.1 PAS domain S-box-containing protein [Cytobacillus purgationiresistens]